MENPIPTIKKENIEDTELFRLLKIRAVEPSKAATARIIALILVCTFTGMTFLSYLVGLYILYKSGNLDEKVLSLATEFLKASGTIFTPLLAFVLGYYFSKREE